MAKNRLPKYIVDRRKERPAPAPQPKKPVNTGKIVRTSLRWAKRLSAFFLASLGLATGYLSLIPRLSVSQDHPLNVNDPFSTPFILSNDGPLGINALELSCLIIDAKGKGAEIQNINMSMGLAIKRMEPGERATIPCTPAPASLGVPLESGDAAVIVTFRPDFVFWKKLRAFRFTTLLSSDGHLYWYPQPATGPATMETGKL